MDSAFSIFIPIIDLKRDRFTLGHQHNFAKGIKELFGNLFLGEELLADFPEEVDHKE